MTNELTDHDADAAGWVLRMAEPDWGTADEAALEAWLAADAGRRGALLKTQALWAALDGEATSAVPLTPGNAGEEPEASQGPFASRRWLLGAGAAIAASIVGGLFLRDKRYETAIGEIRRVPLADGSFASINTDSVVAVNLGETARRVELSKGEAWFQVAKDPRRPFTVAAGRVRAQAVGTAFSVRRRHSGADIMVTEGVVIAWADGAEGNRIRLRAGESAFVADNAAIRSASAGAPGVDRALAWRAGKIDLVSMSLGDAAVEFNRYNVRQIEIVDPALRSEQLDGVFGTNDPETFAMAVRDGLSVPIDLSSPARILIGARHE